jgi:nucleoside phosphorylase/8-oxo-dGTP pyrophosphatase MutT (NUDIX family)
MKSVNEHSVDRDTLIAARPLVELVIVTATEIESRAVWKFLTPLPRRSRILKGNLGNNTYRVGKFGLFGAAHVRTAMGSSGRDASILTTYEAIGHWSPKAVIMPGIAFGFEKDNRRMLDLLIAEEIVNYEPERVGTQRTSRGGQVRAPAIFRDRAMNTNGTTKSLQARRHVGRMLSGEKLVDNKKFRDDLLSRYPEAIGGEMEGAGVVAACERARVDWLIAKAICDWGDGNKMNTYQRRAATVSTQFFHDMLSRRHAFDGVMQPAAEANATASPKSSPRRAWRWHKSALGVWRDKLNAAFAGKAEIAAILRNEPLLEHVGRYPVPPNSQIEIDRIANKIVNEKGPSGSRSNEYHAILSENPIYHDGGVLFRFYREDYATLRALEITLGNIPSLYAGALVCCSETEQIFLHKRSDKVDKYKNCLHTMSGNFSPAGPKTGAYNSDTGTKDTARREIFEEMNVPIEVSASSNPLMLIREIETGRWLLLYHGSDIPKSETANIKGSGEGEVVSVHFDKLIDTLNPERGWAPSGQLHVLTWLALGAVTFGEGPGFDRKRAHKHINQWLSLYQNVQ